MRPLNIRAALASLSAAATGARIWADTEAAANGGTLPQADAEMIGAELSAIGALQDELNARALDLATVIGMLAECEAALRQMADDVEPGRRPIYDATEQAHKAIRKARRELEETHAKAHAGGIHDGIVDPMTGRRI